MCAEKLDRYIVAGVARRLEPYGEAKVQSLRNQQGAEFRAVIEAYREAPKLLLPKIDSSQLEVSISLIPDPSVRVVLKEFFAENKRLKHENDQLRSAFKNLSIGSQPVMIESERRPALVSEQDVMRPNIDSHGLEVLMKSLDPKRLKERWLRITGNGAVEDAYGVQLFPPGFSHAISGLTHGK